jgi:threonine dehydrogenase-like Zn-dependent dehydrogenase
MKAAVYTRYGPPDVVQITDVEKPVPNEDEVLIKVRAASNHQILQEFRHMPNAEIVQVEFCAKVETALVRSTCDAATFLALFQLIANISGCFSM